MYSKITFLLALMETASPAVRVTDLSVTLDGHLIINNVSFTVPVGETTAIIGPNGAGKSVLLKAILGLVPISHGRVEILGRNQTQYRRVAPRVSYIPQSLSFDDNFPLTVRGLFSFKSTRLIGMRATERTRMRELLERVGMKDFENAKLSTLSGGQLQRVLLGYSLLNKPQLLILDEPAAGIDISGQETIYSLLQRIQAEDRLTLLLVSHELDIVIRYANQVLCLNRDLLCAGVPHDVLSPDLLAKMYGEGVGHFVHQDHKTS